MSASLLNSPCGFSGRFMMARKRMMARVGLILGAALVSFGYVKCTFLSDPNATTGNGTTGSDFSTTLTLQDSAGAPTTSFTMGQAIKFDLGVLNQADQA